MRVNTLFTKFATVAIIAALSHESYARSIQPRYKVITEEEILNNSQEVSVQARGFGEIEGCKLVRTGAYRSLGSVVIRYSTGKCESFKNFETKLVTSAGRYDASAIANAKYNGEGTYYVVKGKDLLIRYSTPKSLSDDDIETSGMWRSACVSWDCVIDYNAINAIEQNATLKNANKSRSLLSSNRDFTEHPLVKAEPTVIGSSIYSDTGSLEPIDWYVGGLNSVEKRQKSIRSDFLKYHLKRRVFDYDSNFSGPFEKSDFEKALIAEHDEFVNRVFNFSAQELPNKLVSFTPIVLESYENGMLKLSTCRELDQNRMSCGGAGAIFPTDNLTDVMKNLASQGPLASSGRVVPVSFRSFFNGDNNGAPVYILNRGLPATISVKMPEATARALYEMAKLTKVRQEYSSEFGGKMLSAKIVYGPPKIKAFGTSNAVNKTLFMTFNGGAAIEYSTPAKSICIFDGQGDLPLYCNDNI